MVHLNLIKRGFVPIWARMQQVHDAWRMTDRICRWYGQCVVCKRNCYAFDDGENDPRGALGDNALWTTDAPGDENFQIRTCAICANDSDSYQAAQQIYRDAVRQAGSLVALLPIEWP